VWDHVLGRDYQPTLGRHDRSCLIRKQVTTRFSTENDRVVHTSFCSRVVVLQTRDKVSVHSVDISGRLLVHSSGTRHGVSHSKNVGWLYSPQRAGFSKDTDNNKLLGRLTLVSSSQFGEDGLLASPVLDGEEADACETCHVATEFANPPERCFFLNVSSPLHWRP
jgi:hypothetical protein